MNPISQSDRRARWFILLIIASTYIASLIYRVEFNCGGNVTGLFCIGDNEPIPVSLQDKGFYIHHGWNGYDGQFSLYLAYDPLLKRDLLRSFDSRAYRYQRIGLPMLAHVLVLGNERAIPYAVVGINLAAFLLGCWFFLCILEHLNASPWWVLAYAFSPGLMASEFRVLFDATSTSLIVLSIWALLKERWTLVVVFLCIGALVRETTVLFATAVAMAAFSNRDTKRGMLLLLPWAVYAAWVGYMRARIGSWPFGPGIEANTDWPLFGVVEKFIVYLPKIKDLDPNWPWLIPVEVIFNLGLLFALYLAVKRFDQTPRDWLTLGLCAYAALAVVLSAFPWSRFWHTARVLEPLLLFSLLIYLQTREKKYLVPVICAAPVSVLVALSPR